MRGGFQVVRSSYWKALLLPIVWLVRRVRSGRHLDGSASSDLGRLPRPLHSALTALLAVESRVATRSVVPFGTSIVCVARRA